MSAPQLPGLYLAGLLVSIAGLLFLDLRSKLFVFAAPVRAAVVLVVGVAGFLAWDAAGVAQGVFFEGVNGLLVGVDLAPDVPLEELFFLLLLCLTAMDAFLLADRLLPRRRRSEPGSRTPRTRPDVDGERRPDRFEAQEPRRPSAVLLAEAAR